jgi:hypothetical protein
MQLIGHVAHMEETRNSSKLIGKHLSELGVWIILNWVLIMSVVDSTVVRQQICENNIYYLGSINSDSWFPDEHLSSL